MIRLYLVATDEQNARERLVQAVKYAAGDGELMCDPPALFTTADEARAALENDKAMIAYRTEHGTGETLNPEFIAFVGAADVFTVEVLDVLVGQVPAHNPGDLACT